MVPSAESLALHQLTTLDVQVRMPRLSCLGSVSPRADASSRSGERVTHIRPPVCM